MKNVRSIIFYFHFCLVTNITALLISAIPISSYIPNDIENINIENITDERGSNAPTIPASCGFMYFVLARNSPNAITVPSMTT